MLTVKTYGFSKSFFKMLILLNVFVGQSHFDNRSRREFCSWAARPGRGIFQGPFYQHRQNPCSRSCLGNYHGESTYTLSQVDQLLVVLLKYRDFWSRCLWSQGAGGRLSFISHLCYVRQPNSKVELSQGYCKIVCRSSDFLYRTRYSHLSTCMCMSKVAVTFLRAF